MIHYHGCPLSGSDEVQLAYKGRHAMVSFAAPEIVSTVAEVCQSFALDNGAFSYWTNGTPFNVHGFAEWVTLWAHHPGCDFYCLPDDIDGGPDENAALRARFFALVDASTWHRGIPIWHLHEPLSVLQGFLAWPNPTIALGSSGAYASVGSPEWWRRMAEAMEVICDGGIPKKRIHGLRMLDPEIFSHCPFSSADSTNVARNIGIDQRWGGPYAPRSRRMRALIMMDRIESHASAATWRGSVQQGFELLSQKEDAGV